MGEPVSTTALIVAGISAASSLAGGFAQASSLQSQAKEAEYNARNIELQGKQMSAARRVELNRSFAAIDAIRAGRNVASGSPTDFAIRSDLRRRSREAEGAENLGVRIAAVGQRTRADQARKAAPWAVLGGATDALRTGYSLGYGGG